jgi:tRNA 2-(methylsulfanyl)-N6-isopentenyladenosine37 hydroxylase
MKAAATDNSTLLEPIYLFLHCETPVPWLQAATRNLPELLIDHANCEKKAAATAMNLMYRYTDRPELMKKMSQLAREELLHFQQVVELMQQRGITYKKLSPSRYAAGLRQLLSTNYDANLVDTLIIGALIEARSCERFAKLVPHLDTELGKFYQSLLKSEARHFEDYLALAELYSETDISDRVQRFAAAEAELITTSDTDLRFHSGVPSL